MGVGRGALGEYTNDGLVFELLEEHSSILSG